LKKTLDFTLYELLFTPTTSYFHLRTGKDSRFRLPVNSNRTRPRAENLTVKQTDQDSQAHFTMITVIMMIEPLIIQ
jgi:hypothetical protein